MQKITMKALRAFPYAGRRIKAGEVFDARGSMRPGSDPSVLQAIGHAIPFTGTYNTRAMTAAPVAPVVATSSIDAMDRDELYSLALARGLKPHHLIGAVKLRALLAGQ